MTQRIGSMDSRVWKIVTNPMNMHKYVIPVMHLKGNMMLRGAGRICSMQGGRQYTSAGHRLSGAKR